MKPSSYLINTSRGPIVVESDLIAALRSGRIAGAGVDVFDIEPPPVDHPFRSMDNVTISPHLGYVTHETLRAFYTDALDALVAFADGKPIRVANPPALEHGDNIDAGGLVKECRETGGGAGAAPLKCKKGGDVAA